MRKGRHSGNRKNRQTGGNNNAILATVALTLAIGAVFVIVPALKLELDSKKRSNSLALR